MEAKAIFTVAKGALLPADDRAGSLISGSKIGDKVLVKVHRARNPEHNALAHVVFDRIAKAIGQPMDVVKLWLKWETGRVDLVKMPNGTFIANPRSLSFESMSQEEFQSFWNDAWPVIGEKIMPGLPEKEFAEIRAIVAREAA